MNRQFILLLLLPIFFLGGCQSTSEIDVWPLVYYEHDEKESTTHLDILTNFYSYTSTPDEKTHAFRPFFVGEFPQNKDELRLMFLWPFIYYQNKPDEAKIWIIPFYYSKDKTWPELGERDFDWFFLPFFTFGGTDTKEGPYLFMGFWGNIKGLFAMDEIEGKPFPFYMTFRDGDYKSKAYMWPFFRFGEGGGKKFSFYAFMYSNYEKEGKFRRRSYVWPFIHYNLEQLDKKHPVTEFMFFPFYGQSTSEVSTARSFLWPFFSYSIHEPNNYREYNMPWPFFKYRTGAGQEEFRAWPLYWTIDKDLGNNIWEKDRIYMWPFFWHSKSEYPSYSKESLYILPFYWSHFRQGKEEGAKPTRRTKIWPFYEYSEDEDGSTRQRALSLFWFEDYMPEGFEKAWVPLFTLFDYNKGEGDNRDFTFLGPFYKYRAKKDSLYHRVLFFSYKNVHKPDKDMSRFSVLGGLFEYKHEDGESGLRFFYLPHLSWGDKKEYPKSTPNEKSVSDSKKP